MSVDDYKKGQVWKKSKNKLMLAFEEETGKNAVYRDMITGGFEAWLYKKKNKAKIIETIKEEATPVEIPIIDISPATFKKVNQKLLEAMSKVFSYTINFLNPESKWSKGKNFNKIIIDTTCPSCGAVLHCTDCWKKKTLIVTYMRMCHKCGVIYFFTCKYENKEEFKEKYNFFVEYIYKKRASK